MSNEYSGPPRPSFEEPSRQDFLGYYHGGVEAMTPSANKGFRGRILPGFDWALSKADAQFGTSWAPYRDASVMSRQTHLPEFTSFFLQVRCYTWFGKEHVRFLSPETRRFLGCVDPNSMRDPIQDIRRAALKDAHYKHLTQRDPNSKDNPVIPFPSQKCLFNVYGDEIGGQNMRNMIIDVSKKAVEDLQHKLDTFRRASDEVWDPEWADYMLGDVTNPSTGAATTVTSIPSTPLPFNGFVFNASHTSTGGLQRLPVGPDILAGRYNLWSEDVLRILSAQEIVDIIVADGMIPYELIERVCGGYANVGPEVKQNTVVSSPAYTAQHSSAASVASPTASYAPPAAPTAPAPPSAPAAPAQDTSVWVVGSDSQVTKSSREETQARIDAGESVKVMSLTGSEWVEPSALGFDSPDAIVQAPVAPAAPAPPAPPAPPSAPAAPVNTAAPEVKAAGGASSGLTAEEQMELDNLLKQDINTMDAESTVRLMMLSSKAGAGIPA